MKVESRNAATASTRHPWVLRKRFGQKKKFATSDRSLNIRPGNIEKVLTSREKVESCSAANSSYHASLADKETFLSCTKKFYLLPFSKNRWEKKSVGEKKKLVAPQ